MRSSSRPHRHTRSVPSYKDSFSDGDDDLLTAPPNRQKTEPPGRKNLALKRASRSQERANAKERAEAVQLQRAIKESLSNDITEVKRVSSETSDQCSLAKDVVDSEDEVGNVTRNDSMAFQCLLDVASEAGFRSSLNAHETTATMVAVEDTAQQLGAYELSVPVNRTLNDTEISTQAAAFTANAEDMDSKEVSEDKDEEKSVVKSEDDWSVQEDEEEEDCTDESSDVSEDSGCKRKKARNLKQQNKTTSKKQITDKILTAQVKKVRSCRPAPKRRAWKSESSCSFASSLSKEPRLEHAKAVDGKENMPTTNLQTMTRKVVKKHVMNFSEQKETGNGALTATSCRKVINFQADSPPLLHRRVIGLSRRFRPPPLHPYLSKTNG